MTRRTSSTDPDPQAKVMVAPGGVSPGAMGQVHASKTARQAAGNPAASFPFDGINDCLCRY
jgi:hypothetical protein